MKFLNIIPFAIALLMVPVTAADAKKKNEMSPMQIQEMQVRDLETTKAIAFSSVMSVLQDSGYRINAADKETGLITATASTQSKTTWVPFVGFGKSKKTPMVSAYIEEITPNMTKVRLNFVMSKTAVNNFGGGQDEDPILEPFVYQDAFEKINQAVFVRQATTIKPDTAPVAPATPASE